MSRRQSTRGFGEGEPNPGGWRRHLDPIAWHTIFGVIAGFLISAIVGVTLNPYGLRTEDDVDQAFHEGYAQGYAEVADQAFAEGVPVGYARRLLLHLVMTADAAVESEYAVAFREGWTQGWNGAILAMRDSATEVGLEATAVEFTVLGEMKSR